MSKHIKYKVIKNKIYLSMDVYRSKHCSDKQSQFDNREFVDNEDYLKLCWLVQQRDKLIEAATQYILDCSCEVTDGNSLDVLKKAIKDCEGKPS